MTFTLTFAWWWIPTLISVVGVIWAIFFVDGGRGLFSGMANVMALGAVGVVSAIAWAVFGFLK